MDATPKVDAVVPDQADELVEVVFNNRTIKVPQSTKDIILSSEHEMKSAMNAKMMEAADTRKQLESSRTALEEDIAFYKEHEMAEWDYYEPKVKGGRGYIGPEGGVKKDEPTEPGQGAVDAFSAKQTISALESRLKNVESLLTQSAQEKDIATKHSVDVALGSVVKKYPLVDVETVTDKCIAYFHTNGKHPTPDIVDGFAKQLNDKTEAIIKKAGSGDVKPTSVLPSVGGEHPTVTQKTDVIDLSDPDYGKKALARLGR